jgi:hypothetical protein
MNAVSTTETIAQRVADLGSLSKSVGSVLQQIWTLKASRQWSESYDSVDTYLDLLQLERDLQLAQDRIHRKIRKSSEGTK